MFKFNTSMTSLTSLSWRGDVYHHEMDTQESHSDWVPARAWGAQSSLCRKGSPQVFSSGGQPLLDLTEKQLPKSPITFPNPAGQNEAGKLSQAGKVF